MRIFFVSITFILTVYSLRAQSLSITPHFNLLFPTCRLADNTQGYDTFGAQTFSVFSGDLGVFLEYKSKTRWGLMSGLSIGSAGLGYKISYQKPGALVSRFDIGISKSNSLHRIPLLFTYTWKNIHLFQLRNFRKLSQKKSIKVIDESILYAIVFKLQPIIGGSINYIGQLNRWDDPEDTLNTRRTVMYYDIHFSSKQLSTVNVSAIIGLRLQFYSFGKDKLALTVLYHQGFSDLVEMEVNYTIDGSDPYKSYVRTRGSGLSVTLSYPIQIYNFNKQQRKLRRQNN